MDRGQYYMSFIWSETFLSCALLYFCYVCTAQTFQEAEAGSGERRSTGESIWGLPQHGIEPHVSVGTWAQWVMVATLCVICRELRNPL